MKYDKNLGSRIGMLTPSSNTCLEPITYAIVAPFPEISVHFSRFKVTRTGLDEAALSQFDTSYLVEAAEMLADADVDSIVWNGSSGSWMPDGKALDEELCAAITDATGIPTTTMTFAVWEAFKLMGIKRYSLVTPFNEEMSNQIIKNYDREGFTCVRSVNLTLETSIEKDRVPPDKIRDLIASAADERADGIAVICTNFRGAPAVDEMERVLNKPIVDSVSATAWKALDMLGNKAKVDGWGRLLRREYAIPSN